jgi:putative ABC transport system ATP-binding protein
MFRLEGIKKAYTKRGHEVVAFQAERLEIAAGEYVAVVGPSGSGKTTLLSILGGMLSPSQGRVILDDVDLYALKSAQRTRLRRQRIGFVFQTFNLLPYLSAIENVQVPLFLSGLAPAEQRERATLLLEDLGLADRLHHTPSELSTGQQQRVALARTLSNDPRIILADEPTGNLDPDSRGHVLEMFDTCVSEGRTVIMVTHDTRAAQRAGRMIRLVDGKIVDSEIAEGTTVSGTTVNAETTHSGSLDARHSEGRSSDVRNTDVRNPDANRENASDSDTRAAA